MIDILGWGEWVIIGALMLILIGPKDLPRVLYKLGQWFHKFKESTTGIREEFEGLLRLEHLKALGDEEEKLMPPFVNPTLSQEKPSRRSNLSSTDKKKSKKKLSSPRKTFKEKE